MGLEVGPTGIADLNVLWPLDADSKSAGAAHLRNLKAVLDSMFPDGQVETIESLTTRIIARISSNDALAEPIVAIDRLSASPAANDLLGEFAFLGRDSGGAVEKYAAILAQIIDPTAASEDARLNFRTIIAGALAIRGYFQNGLVLGSPTGGDQGLGTINLADGAFRNGVRQGAVLAAGAFSANNFTYDGFPSWVNHIRLTIDAVPNDDAVSAHLYLRKSVGTDITSYNGSLQVGDGSSTSDSAVSGGSTLEFASPVQNDANSGGVFAVCEVANIQVARYKRVLIKANMFNGTNHLISDQSWQVPDTSPLTGIIFFFGSGGVNQSVSRYLLEGFP